MIEIDDLDGAGKVPVGLIPDPDSSVSENHFEHGPLPTSAPSLGVDAEAERLGGLDVYASNNYQYAVSAVPTGSFTVSARTILGDSTTVSFPCGGGTMTGGQNITVDCIFPGIGFVVVTVVDGAGNPLTGMRVHFPVGSFIGPVQTFSTVAGGTASTYVSAGSFTVTAEDPVSGFGSSVNGTVAPNGQAAVTITIQSAASGTVKGVISYDGTRPVPHPNVFLTQVDINGNT